MFGASERGLTRVCDRVWCLDRWRRLPHCARRLPVCACVCACLAQMNCAWCTPGVIAFSLHRERGVCRLMCVALCACFVHMCVYLHANLIFMLQQPKHACMYRHTQSNTHAHTHYNRARLVETHRSITWRDN